MLRKLELPIVIFLACLVMFLNLLPFLHRLRMLQPNEVFLGSQFYTLDYNIYAGHFKEGAKGVWRIHDKHTSEPHQGFLLRREYWLWGFLTGFILKLPIWAVYHSARIVAGFALLFVIYRLISKVFPDQEATNYTQIPSKASSRASFSTPLTSIKAMLMSFFGWFARPRNLINHKSYLLNHSVILRLSAFVLATLVAGFPKTIIDPATGAKSIDLYLFWFLELDPAQRFATLFHYLIGNILLLLFILQSTKLFRQKINFKSPSFIFNFSFFICLGLSAGLTHPSTLATIYLMIPIYLGLKFFTLALPRLITTFLNSVSVLSKTEDRRQKSENEDGSLKKEIQLQTPNFKHHYPTSTFDLQSSIPNFLRQLLLLLLFALFTLPVVPFVRSQTSTFPWDQIAKWDAASVPFIPLREYTMAIGPIYYLGIIGIGIFLIGLFTNNAISTIPFLKKFISNSPLITSINKLLGIYPLDANCRNSLHGGYTQSAHNWRLSRPSRRSNLDETQSEVRDIRSLKSDIGSEKSGIEKLHSTSHTLLLLLLSFILASFLWIFKLFPFLPEINRIRFMQVPIFIPFAIFSAIALSSIFQLLGDFIAYCAKTILKIENLFIAFSLLSLILLTKPAYTWGVKREYTMFPAGSFLLYSPRDIYAGYQWLDRNTNPLDVVLSSFYSSTLLPGQSGNTVFWGHPWSTVNANDKAILAERFMRSDMTAPEAKSFLQKNNISYYLEDPQARAYGGDLSKYSSFLTPVFSTPQVTIYHVNF